ncbi:MAG: acyl-CoA dehydrogenase family protein [Pseudomonadales bacterium]
MDFTFTEDQLLFQDSVRDFLINEVTAEKIRGLWETETGRSDELWAQLAELGLTGMTVPEEFGGLGMNELDFILLAQESGYVALPEPLLNTVLVGVPLLIASGSQHLQQQWLPKIAAGEARIAIGLDENLLVEDAHVADLLLLQSGDELHALTRDQVALTFSESVDPSRRLFDVQWTPTAETCVASGAAGLSLIESAINRGALASAAQALGLTQRMIDLSVQYTSERQQFGKPIGSFQAVKHHMSNVAVSWEYAKAPVYRAAYAIAYGQERAGLYVSHAKLAATAAADLAARNCTQVHGAMGYTWEVDLHIFVKKAWALNNSWGDRAYHKQIVAEYVFGDNAALGAGATF